MLECSIVISHPCTRQISKFSTPITMRLSWLVFAGSAIASLWQDQVVLGTESAPQLKSETESSLLEFHKNLITIPSVSGNELAVAKYLGSYLKSLN